MDRQISKIQPSEWQRIVNEECAHFAPKTVATAWGFIRSIVHYETGQFPPSVKLAAPVRSQKAFLQPEEIKPFVAAAAETRYAIPLLLALSSLRISEIAALRWEDIRIDDDFIYVRGAVVQDENHKWVAKKTNKNLSSSRNVPIFIPELKNALVNGKKESGPVMEIRQCTLLRALHKICAENDLTDVTVHGLRHSFASLGYHLGLPEEIIMEIGGWHDLTTMKKIYTHIAQSDRTRYHNEMRSFYKNAYENAHE